jgi:hypothetical protein
MQILLGFNCPATIQQIKFNSLGHWNRNGINEILSPFT